jgi:nucleoid-associated protein YgaU
VHRRPDQIGAAHVGPAQIGPAQIDKVRTMDQSVKIAAACGVLLSGIVAALLFRHESPQIRVPLPEGSDQLVLRKQMPPSPDARPVPETRPGRLGLPKSTPNAPWPFRREATILRPMDPGQPPPPLAKDYPGTDDRTTSGWGTSIGLPAPSETTRPDQSAPRTHKIVDGDALRELAERYLGSADRYLELYEANQDVLPSPQILPIGVKLNIPPPHTPAPPSSETTASQTLVPVPREANREE